MATRAGVPECSTSPMAVRSSARSIRASPMTGYWGARRVDLGVDRIAIPRPPRRPARGPARPPPGSRLGLGQVALEDRLRGPLPEVRLEDRRQREPAPGPPTPDPVSPRHRRPGRSRHARSSPSRRSTVAATAVADLAGERPEGLARAGDDPEPDGHAVRRGRGRVTARPPSSAPPRRAAAADPGDARHLEGGQPDELAR